MKQMSIFKTNEVMRQWCDVSTGSLWFSLLLSLGSCGLGWYIYSGYNSVSIYTFSAVVALLNLLALIYMPANITIEGDSLAVYRSCWCKRLPISEIESIELMQPTMGTKAIFASMGFWGYWGWYREPNLGKYFAMYGNPSNCFFVRMKDGRQYMLGCKNPATIVDYVKNHLDA
ncbi:MAG: hypothetical protein HDR88_08150 [Bacteroides sp.]|nr:hypothetical protein [Bacteroides sp.]